MKTLFQKKKLILFISLLGSSMLFIILAFIFAGKISLSERRELVLSEAMMKSLSFMHYSPPAIDNDFSEEVFYNYLSAIDYNKRFLLKPDADKLSIFKNTIDDDIRNRRFLFFNAVENIIGQRIKDASTYYVTILDKPFDFTIDEEIELDAEKNSYAASPSELKEEWRKALKYQVMIRVHQELDIQERLEERSDTVIEIKTLEEIEKDARDMVKRTHDDYFDRLSKFTREDRFGMYLNSISSIFDPHTNYFPPKLRDDFDIAMSGKLEGIGAVLTQRGGYIHVEEVIPGGPAWKQGELQSGDVILKVAQGDNEAVDITSMRLDEAVRLIRGKKGSEARLTVRKRITDEIVVISIIRDVVEIEQTYARSAIIESNNGKRTGYIFLPKFYVDFNNPIFGRSSARDVKQEIIKLQKEGIDALVFDLRNNGGGSLQDVVKITGYFIHRGPVVQVKDKLAGLDVMRATNDDVIYDGPLVIMVNSGSASASEILAAALQDYGRAVIVGSNSTYGKGTVQRMLDLDVLIETDEKGIKPLGSMKLTTQKFFRINGGATQLKGVTPDIILPDRYKYITFGEKNLDNAMEWSSIKPVRFKKWTKNPVDIKNLQFKSRSRIKASEAFNVVDEQAQRLKKQREQTNVTLNLNKYRELQKVRKEENEKFKNILDQATGLNISFTEQDAQALKTDSVKERIMNQWIKGLQKDIYLEETKKIITDMNDAK